MIRTNAELWPDLDSAPEVSWPQENTPQLGPAGQLPTYDATQQLRVMDLEKFRALASYQAASGYPLETVLAEDPLLLSIALEEQDAVRAIARYSGMARSLIGHGLYWVREQIGLEVGQHFDTHGIDKGSAAHTLLLHDLLSNGVDVGRGRGFHSMPLVHQPGVEALGAVCPFPHGGIYVIGDYDNLIKDGGIKYVVLDERFIRVIDLLRQKYPGYIFLPWHDAPRVLTERYNELTGKNMPLPELRSDNHPAYSSFEEAYGPLPVDPSPIVLVLEDDSRGAGEDDDVW